MKVIKKYNCYRDYCHALKWKMNAIFWQMEDKIICLKMISEGLVEMFEGDFADMCAKIGPLMLIGVEWKV